MTLVRLFDHRLTAGLHGLLGGRVGLFAPDFDHVVPCDRMISVERRPRSIMNRRKVSMALESTPPESLRI